MWLSRPIEGGVHTPNELFQLRHELSDASSCGEFGERRHLLNLRSDIQVRYVDWIHLLQSFQEVARVGVPPTIGLDLPLEKIFLHDFLMSVHLVWTSACC